MKYYAKKDILVVESYIKAGDEVLLLKKGEEKALISCTEDNLFKWIDLDKFNDLIEERKQNETKP
jgi:hypothetical protein